MKSSSDLSFYIETLGCAKNVVDSRTMRSNLLRNGFSEKSRPEEADFILINTCSFVKEAQESTIESIFEAVKLKRKKQSPKVGIIGCFTQQFADTLKDEIPEADFFLGTRKYHQIANHLSSAFDIRLQPPTPGESIKSLAPQGTKPVHGYFRVAQGCSRKCSFCIIPSIRGPLESFTLDDMRRQYEEELSGRDSQSPLKEIVLVSQDTISTPIEELEKFIRFFNEISEVSWIRLHYLFPDKRMFDLIDLMNGYSKVVPYIDIPFQHISPQILRSMNRPDNPELFSDIIQYGLKRNPVTEYRTSFILGYPGETEADVNYITEFLKENPIHKCAVFRYSHEDGTPAFSSLQDTIPDEKKAERMNHVTTVHLESRAPQRQTLLGKNYELIIDEITEKEIIGRRPQDSPEIDEIVFLSGSKSQFNKGDIVTARLDTAMEYDWIGEIVE